MEYYIQVSAIHNVNDNRSINIAIGCAAAAFAFAALMLLAVVRRLVNRRQRRRRIRQFLESHQEASDAFAERGLGEEEI